MQVLHQRCASLDVHKKTVVVCILVPLLDGTIQKKSGRDMLAAMIEGTADVEVLADLARGALRKKIPQLRQALEGYVLPHHRTFLHHILTHIEFLEETLAQLQHDIDEHLQPYEEAVTLLQSIPGRCRSGSSGPPFRDRC
jgi:transposase